jgi:hypothetical protein
MSQGLVSVAKEELLSVFREALTENRDKQQLDVVEGIKYFRLPTLYATPASGTVVLGEAWAGQPYTGQQTGPNQGFVWSIRRLSANGLGTGTSPDILNVYRNGHSQPPVWQLNGNNWGYSFGPTELLLLPGEKLIAQSLGSLVSTTQISLTGDAIEVPQAMLGKLVL